MNTITKSTKKSLLAATVVALLALVAVAGAVTYSADDSDASTSVNYNYVQGSYTPTSDQATANFFVYGANTTNTITIGNFTYTGTITFGYHSSVNGANYDVAYATVAFTGLSNATVIYDASLKTITVNTTASDAQVDMTVTAGTISIGSSVSGTITAADATLTLSKVSDLDVTVLNGKAYLSGDIATGTVTVSGTAYEYDSLTVSAGAKLVIADGATVTTCTKVTDKTYDFAYTSAINSTSGYVAMTNATLYGYHTSTVVQSVTASSTSTLATASFTGISDGIYTMEVTYTTTANLTGSYYYDVVVWNGQFYVFPTFAVTDTSGTATYVAADSTATTTPTYAYYKFTLATSDSSLTANDVTLVTSSGNLMSKDRTSTASGVYYVTVDKGIITFYISVADFTTSGQAVSFYASVAGEAYVSVNNLFVEQIKVTPIFTGTSTKTYSNGTFAATKTAAPTDYTAGAAANEVGTVSFTVTATDTAAVTSTTYDAALYNLKANNSAAIPAAVNSAKLSFSNIEPGTYLMAVTSTTGSSVTYNAYVVTVATSNGVATVSVTAVAPSLVASSYSGTSATLTVASAALGTYLDETTVSAYYGDTPATTSGNFTYNTSTKVLTTSATVNAHGYLNLIYNGVIVYHTTTPAISGNGTVVLGTITLSISNASSVIFKTAGKGVAASITNNGTLAVNGTLKLVYDSVQVTSGSSGYASITGNISSIVNVSGELVIDSASTGPFTTGVNAAYYYNSTAASSAPLYTFHYTTLAAANAVSAATSITVIGTIAIDSDLSITAGTSSAVRTLTIASGAVLKVGTSSATAVLTVPATATNTFTTTGTVEIINGSVKIAGETTDRGSSIVTAVFMQQTVGSVTYGVYTDLATAMAAAVSGDTVTLRGNASVVSDVVIPVGVTLALSTYDVTVGAYNATAKTYTVGSLTVNGTIAGPSSNSTILIYQGSTVTVNSSDASTDLYQYQLGSASTAPLGGTLVIGEDATMAYVKAVAYSGAITVNGTVTSAMGAGNIYGAYTLTVNGTMTMYGSAVADMTSGTTALAYNVVVAKGATLKTSGTFENASTAFTLTVNGTVTPIAATVFENDNSAAGTFDIAGSMATTTAYTLSITNYNTSSAKTVAIKVTGVLAVAGINDANTNTIAMTVSGTGAFTSTGNVALKSLTVSDSASFKMIGTSSVTATIGTLTVTGTATVIGEATATAVASSTSVATITASKFTIGTASTKLAASTNDATVSVILPDASGVYGVVYGTAANVNVTAATATKLVKTALYLVGTNDNILYATEYGNTTNETAKLVLDTLSTEGYKFTGWFNATSGGQTVTSGVVGSIASVYAIFEPKTYTVTFNYLAGAVYLVNGDQVQSGQYTYNYGTELSVSVIAASNYDASKATIQLNTTSPSTGEIDYTVTADATFTAAGVTEKTISNSMSITDILLIILVVITAIVAIAVVMKLARS